MSVATEQIQASLGRGTLASRQTGGQNNTTQRLSYTQLTSSARYCFAMVGPGLAQGHYAAMEPILAKRLVEKDLQTMQRGLFFCILAVCYTLNSLTLHKVPLTIEKRARLITAHALNFVAYLLVGPSLLLQFPDSLTLMCLGQALGGATAAHICAPCLLEMLDSGKERFPDQEDAVTNMSAAIYNAFLGLGYLLAPLYGTSVAEHLGFRLTMDILAFFDLAFAIAYFALAGGMGAFKSLCTKDQR